jgi:hypothetical protein
MRRLTLLPDATRCTAAILCLGFVAFAVANVPTATGADYPKQNHPPDRRLPSADPRFPTSLGKGSGSAARYQNDGLPRVLTEDEARRLVTSRGCVKRKG